MEIENDIALTWKYPVELTEKKDTMSRDEYFDLTIKNATKLFVLEGDWKDDTVESFNNMFRSGE